MARFYPRGAYNFRMPNPKIFWFAMAFSTVIYAVVLYTVAPVPPRPFQESLRSTFTLVLYGVAFITFIAALLMPGRLPVNPPHKKMIVAMAMFEACAIHGLMAAFMQQDWRLYVLTWIAALIGFVREFPRDEVTSPLL
jgi:CDP-diglyceride synthetase